MHLPKFEYLAPKTMAEACSLLSEHGGDAVVLAGGTDLVVRMRQRLAVPEYVIALKSIKDMDYIHYDAVDGLRIGALTPLHALETSETIIRRYGAVAQSAAQVASPQVRNVATLGGNICLDTRCLYYNQSLAWRQSRPPCFKTGGSACHVVKGGKRCYALFSSDTTAPLISLEAKVQVLGPEGERLMPLEELYSGKGETPMADGLSGRIVSEIQVPPLPRRTGIIYVKECLGRSVCFPLVGVAARLSAREDGKECADVRLVLTAVASAPVRAGQAETLLRGETITEELVAAAAEASLQDIGPLVAKSTSVDYKRKLVRFSVRKALKAAWDRARTAGD